MQLARFSNSFRVFRSPPVAQVALRVELAAFVVEAVGQFVSDGAAGVAVVGGVVRLGIEERRLQNAGGEVDVVHLRIVVGVDGGRSHAPLAAVHGLADLGQLAVEFELSAHATTLPSSSPRTISSLL